MTEHPYEKSQIPQLNTPHKRPLTNINSLSNFPNNGLSDNEQSNFDQKLFTELTESNLKSNVQIVLKNLNKNILRNYFNERVNNNSDKKMSSPESDCNSNIGGGGFIMSGPLGCSIASSQDFTHDNSDYQWFLDYG